MVAATVLLAMALAMCPEDFDGDDGDDPKESGSDDDGGDGGEYGNEDAYKQGLR